MNVLVDRARLSARVRRRALAVQFHNQKKRVCGMRLSRKFYTRCAWARAFALGGGLSLLLLTSAVWSAESVEYQYDDAGRLHIVTYENNQTTTYTLDATGNRTQVDKSAVPVVLSVAAASASEGGSLAFTVTRSGGTSQTVLITCRAVSGSATSPSDFTATDTVLSFAASDTSKTCSIPSVQDSIYEGNETFTLSLVNPSGPISLASGSAIGTIIDNDAAPSFTIADLTVNENAGTATLTISRSGATAFTHSVSYATASGSAIAGSDFTAVNGALSFAPAETSKPLSVAIANDAVYEGNETFVVNLSAPTQNATIGDSQAVVTIAEDDLAPQFSVNDISRAENGGPLVFTITKTGATTLSHVVSFVTSDGTAVAGNDYGAVNSSTTFAPNDVTRPVAITLVNDGIYENDEAFTLTLNSVTNNGRLGDNSGVGTIVNDDPPQRGTLQFAPQSPDVNEGAGSITLTVQRVGGSDLPASVYCRTRGFGPSEDFVAVNTLLEWTHGDASSRTCTIQIIDDTAYNEVDCPDSEGPCNPFEAFAVDLMDPLGAAVSPTRGYFYVQIHDNDVAPDGGSIQFSTQNLTLEEGQGTASFEVTRTGTAGLFGPASVECSYWYGTASATDFVGLPQRLDWGAGDASPKPCNVTLLNDQVDELTKTMNLRLINLSGSRAGSPSSAVLTITDSDPPAPTQLGIPQWVHIGGCPGACWPSYTDYWPINIDIAWQPTSPGVEWYEQQVQGTWNPTWETHYHGPGTTTSISIPLNGYSQFRVRACNSGGCSGWSEIAGASLGAP